jgi:hypothetical protein
MNARRPRREIRLLTYATWQALKPLVRDIRKRIVRALHSHWWHTLLLNAQQQTQDDARVAAFCSDRWSAQLQYTSLRSCMHTDIRRFVCLVPEIMMCENSVWRCTYVQRNKHTKRWERYFFWIEQVYQIHKSKRVFPCEAARASDGWLYK